MAASRRADFIAQLMINQAAADATFLVIGVAAGAVSGGLAGLVVGVVGVGLDALMSQQISVATDKLRDEIQKNEGRQPPPEPLQPREKKKIAVPGQPPPRMT